MNLDKAMLEQIADEEKARDKYFDMVRAADDAGMHKTAGILRGIAADEARHHMALQQMYQSPELGPMREVPLGRPVPKTYGDWVDLAEGIKTADPTSWTATWVNDALLHISEEDSAAEESKRKLVNWRLT